MSPLIVKVLTLALVIFHMHFMDCGRFVLVDYKPSTDESFYHENLVHWINMAIHRKKCKISKYRMREKVSICAKSKSGTARAERNLLPRQSL